MLYEEGCRERRRRLWDRLPNLPEPLVLADVHHLRYFANCYVTPINLSGDFFAALVMRRDGTATLIHDHRLPASVEAAHVDETIEVPWYSGQEPDLGPRQLAILDKLPAPPADTWGSPLCRTIVEAVAEMRRRKDPDEIDLIKTCCRVAEAGQDLGLNRLRPGMSEIDVYAQIVGACERVAGEPIIVYGDFAVSPGPERRGGPPTHRTIKAGDLMILDFSVVLQGYRCDFTNTVCVAQPSDDYSNEPGVSEPNDDQKRLLELCKQAMAAGEAELRADAKCQVVYDAVNGVFERAGMAEWFPHHAGHGLGLMHPEPPYFVKHSTETLVENDVVTLEPGLYVPDIGGLRIEHNYRITANGFERLSRHRLALRPGSSVDVQPDSI